LFFFVSCTLCCQYLWIVFVLFWRRKTKQKQRETDNIGYTRRMGNQTWTIQRNWQHSVHKTKKNTTKTIQRNWQHRVHKTKKNKKKTHIRLVYHMLSVFSGLFLLCFSSSCVFCGVSFSRLFLFCFSSSCVPYVVSLSNNREKLTA
jgi:hypothetical protein